MRHRWPMQFSTVSQTIPLENRPDDLDVFSMPQVDFNVVIDGKSLADRESQAMRSSDNSCTHTECYILEEIEWTSVVEVGCPLVCGWLG